MASILDISGERDSWNGLKKLWSYPDFHRARISVFDKTRPKSALELALILPGPFPNIDELSLVSQDDRSLVVSFAPAVRIPRISSKDLLLMRKTTELYLRSVNSESQQAMGDYLALIIPDIASEDLENWLSRYGDSEPAPRALEKWPPPGLAGRRIRDKATPGFVRILKHNRSHNKFLKSPDWKMECNSMPRFSKAATTELSGARKIRPKSKVYRVPARNISVDRLPAGHVVFGLCIPIILESLRASLIASDLGRTILKDVGFRDEKLIVTAITAPSAQCDVNYQVYEFIGDTVLKYLVSCWVFQVNGSWDEGRLSGERDKYVRNEHLAQAALNVRLDNFILTEKLVFKRWQAPLASKLQTSTGNQRSLSSKILADVTEALIGAAYLDGGIDKAQVCARCFIPQIRFLPGLLEPFLMKATFMPTSRMSQRSLVRLIGYTFKHPALLMQAFTHPSCHIFPHKSYQRLEFLGDAILDMVVVSVIAAQKIELSPGRMSMIKHAVVNSSLLGFICLTYCVQVSASETEQIFNYTEWGFSSNDLVHIWNFISFGGAGPATALQNCLARSQSLRKEINEDLECGLKYPWTGLTSISPNKFLADVIESILGAIFIDSGGEIDLCEGFLERLGLLGYLRRICAESIDVGHSNRE